MKLSEAIREGCKYGPKTVGQLIHWTVTVPSSFCALGGAFKALGVPNEELLKSSHGRSIVTPWDRFLESEMVCPANPCHSILKEESIVRNVITHLNDAHGWSREAISEWVETVERKLGLWDEPTHDVMAEAQQTVKELTHPVPVQS